MSKTMSLADLIGFKGAPVAMATALDNSRRGDTVGVALATANTVQQFGSVMSEVARKAGAPLVIANLVKDGLDMRNAVKENRPIDDKLLATTASDTVAAAAVAAGLLGAPALAGLLSQYAAATTTRSQQLGQLDDLLAA